MERVTQNTGTSSANVRIGPSSGMLYMITSSSKFKHDIQKSDIDYYKILDVDIYDWFDKNDYLKNGESTDGLKRITGLIADEIANIGLDRFVDYDETGEIVGLHYDRLWTLLIPIVKDLKERLDNLESN